MLSLSDLVKLMRFLRDETVLSVYIDGTSHNPANKQPWRTPLDNALKDIRTWLLRSSHTERADFEKATALLETKLAVGGGAIRAPGWVAFITADRIWYSEAVRTPLPTLAVWSTGICVSPYIRALKQERPVLLAVADSMHVDVYRYELGELRRIERKEAEPHADAPSHMGDAPRVGFHQGVQGMTGRDALERDQLAATAKLMRDVRARLATLAGKDDAILVGGIPSITHQLLDQLPEELASRTLLVDDVDIHMLKGALTPIVERGASTLRNRHDRARLEEIVDLAARDDRGTLGEVDTRRALEQRQVAELYVTKRFIDSGLADAEAAVRNALDQGSTIEEVSGAAAALLDEHGGIGARLRFRAPSAAEEAFVAADRRD
jgi:hypothetical protein